MTGFGDARRQCGTTNVAVEIRAVNNRHLKVTTKCPDAWAALEPDIEKQVRSAVARGTVTVVVRTERSAGTDSYVLNQELLSSYCRQLQKLAETTHLPAPKDLGSLLPLPGVIVEQDPELVELETARSVLKEAVGEALARLNEFRRTEGQATEQDLRLQCGKVTEHLEQVEQRAPEVVEDFRNRLLERVRELLTEVDVDIDRADLLREVSIFAERCDINEEITRLHSHLDQFDTFLNQQASHGRKLEFLSQEIFREVNTIGSKANDVSIAHSVVEMKAAVERLREILQNVE